MLSDAPYDSVELSHELSVHEGGLGFERDPEEGLVSSAAEQSVLNYEVLSARLQDVDQQLD